MRISHSSRDRPPLASNQTAVARASNRPIPQTRWLVCSVGSRRCALSIADVIETLRPLPVEHIAGAPPFVLGVAIVRGAPVPVVDAAGLVGAEQAEVRRFVSLRCGDRRVALAVDSVIGVSELPDGALQDAASLLGSATPEVVGAIGALSSRLLMVLESARLVPDSVWHLLARERAPS